MIPNQAEFLEALRLVTAAFDKLGIQYAVGGSYASSLYGEARATRDVDLIANVTGRHAGLLVAALGRQFYADEAQITAAARDQVSFNLIHIDSMSKIDVYLVWRTDFGATQLARRRPTLPPKIRSWLSWIGIGRAANNLTGNGVTCSAFYGSKLRHSTGFTSTTGQSGLDSAIFLLVQFRPLSACEIVAFITPLRASVRIEQRLAGLSP